MSIHTPQIKNMTALKTSTEVRDKRNIIQFSKH